MNNKEKNLETLAQFALENKIIALKDGKLVECNTCNCSDCSFYPEPGVSESCRDVQKRWAESECEEYSLLDKKEKDFLQFQCDHLSPEPMFIERGFVQGHLEVVDVLYIKTRTKEGSDKIIAMFYLDKEMYQNLMFLHKYTLVDLGLKPRSAKK